MYSDQELYKGTRKEKMGLEEYGAPSDYVPSPPPYPPPAGGPSTSSGIVVASRSGDILPVAAPPPSVPTNGVSVATVLDPIQGSWLLDPLAAPSSGSSILQTIVAHRAERRRPRRLRNATLGAPTAKLSSRLGNISAFFRVVAQSATPATATIQATTRRGNIVLELVSKSPMRMVNFDAYSRMGNVSLLIPRNFSGFVELRAQNGNVELLPALASFARIVRTTDRETVVYIGNDAVPQAGITGTGDLARLCARSGRLRLGFSGEDSFTEGVGGPIAMATQLFQKLTVKSATP